MSSYNWSTFHYEVHIAGPLGGSLTVKIQLSSMLSKYFALNTFTHNKFGLAYIDQTNLAPKALFMISQFRKPAVTFFVGLHILSHARSGCLSSPLPPLQKRSSSFAQWFLKSFGDFHAHHCKY